MADKNMGQKEARPLELGVLNEGLSEGAIRKFQPDSLLFLSQQGTQRAVQGVRYNPEKGPKEVICPTFQWSKESYVLF